VANIRVFGIDQTTGQGRYVESTDVALNISAGGTAAVRVLANPGGTNYTQAALQTLYDGQAGLAAPDTVPQAINDYANTLNTGGYKVYLGANSWYYTNVATGIVAGSWTVFGSGKSAFAANIVPAGILTFN
jgi:hypothetical protein